MGNVLTFCEFTGSSLRSSALSTLTAAQKLAQLHDGQVVALLVGKGAAAAANHAKTLAPKCIVVDDPELENYLAETYAPLLARLVKETAATAIVAAASSTGKDVLPRAAALLDAGMASDIIEVVAKNQFRRPIVAGNAIATVEVSTPVVALTVRQTAFPPATPLSTEGEVQTTSAGPVSRLGAEFIGLQVSKSERPELADAKVVVSGGRGMKSAEGFRALEQLADLLGAAVGASRAATD
ncbi:MAG: FAD-binding protein, partial [Pseudomonadota bacterium]